ncbi:MAG TPA: MBL fold metallo-hydrolase, partial [Usitatibacter sp.]|nr:MBL fold metallo-hydrolase [Usitatibacter sp.]
TTMNKPLAAIAGAIGILLAFNLPAQQDFSKVEIKATQLAPTVYMLEGAGGNIGVSAGEDSVFVIDDQFAPLTPKITAAIAKITSKPVQFVLNTHWHFDHTGGNENLGKAGALIVAHENVRRRMGSEQFIEFMKMKQPASPKAALPVVTFVGSISFHLNGEEIRVIHAPRAHTDGDALVHFTGSDVVHMGDTFFNGMYPFIDASSGGTVDGVIAACDTVLALASDKTRIIPGHGPIASKADLRGYRDMLAALAPRVRKAIAEGKSDEDLAKAGLTSDFDDKFGKGFLKPEQFIVMLAGAIRKAR